MKRQLGGLLLAAALSLFSAFGQSSDTQPPQLTGMSISPPTVDVTSSAQTVNFTLQITDNLSGIDFNSGNRVAVTLRSPAGQSVAGFASPQAGTILSAAVTVPVVIPRYAASGAWQVYNIRLRDNAGNTSNLNNAAIVAAGYPSSVDVIDANPDTQAPTLVSMTQAPNNVDVSAGDVTITVEISLADDISGVRFPDYALSDFELRSPSGKQSRLIGGPQFVRISGTDTNGVWRASFKMPKYSEPGIWKVAAMRLQDAARNVRSYSPATMAVYGSMIEVTVASSPADTTAPTISRVTVIPNFVNTSLGAQTVQVELEMADDLSGVAFRGDTPFISLFYGAYFGSPSGAQLAFTNSTFTNAPPVTGTSLNGVWRFGATLPQFSEEGTWTLRGLQLTDSARNLLMALNPSALASLGASADITVIKPSLVPDGSISDPAAGGTVTDSTFGTRAQLIIPGGVLTQPTNVSIDVLSSPIGVPLPTGYSSAETYYVNVQLTPTPNYPLPAPGITFVMPLRNYVIPGTVIALLRVDPATGNLVPALNVSGAPVTGIVDAGGLTATFVGIARFSTLVGALPTAIPVVVDIKPGDSPNTINSKSKGSIPVAVMSTPTLDLTKVDPATIRLSGAPVAKNKQGKYQISTLDVDGDGLDDIVLHFNTEDLLLAPADTSAVVEGLTLDGRRFRGADSVVIIK